MLYYLIKSNLFPESNEKFYQQALQYIESSNTYLKKKHSEDDIGFLLGSTGVHAVTAAIYDLDIERKSLTKDYAKKFLQAAEFVKNTQWDEASKIIHLNNICKLYQHFFRSLWEELVI